MLFFRKKGGDPDGVAREDAGRRSTDVASGDADEAARREAGRAALSQGMLTPEARARLASPIRSTDLSCAAFLLTRSAGFESLGVVMGSAFHTLNMYYLPTEQRNRYVGELADLSAAHRNARTLAVERLRREAAALGAHGVVGVKLAWKKMPWSRGLIECTAVGTAIRLEGSASPDHPFTSNLSGSEFWGLYNAGYLPRDLVFGAAVYMVACDDHTRRLVLTPFGGGMRNQEIESYNEGLMAARRLASTRLAKSIKASQGEGAVGMEVDYHFHELEYEIGNMTYIDLLITFTAVGTSLVRRGDGAGSIPPSPSISYDLRGIEAGAWRMGKG
jgi:uncharacterized protein YbjQ (UPF0145 family)